jgi:hypothetical protein
VSGLVVCYDTDAPATLPNLPTACFLAYPWTLAPIQARFPNARKIWTITVTGDPTLELDCDGCDSETHAFTEQAAAQWAYNKITGGLGRPFIYIEVANKPLVTAALATLNLEWGRDVDCWIADWDTVPEVIDGVFQGVGFGEGNVAHQYYRDSPDTFDVSVVLADWAFPPQPKEEEMLFVRDPNSGPNDGEICLCSPAGAFNVGNAWTAIKAAYAAAGVPVVLVEDAGLQAAFRAISYHAYTGA